MDGRSLRCEDAAGGSRESDLRPSRRRLAVDHVRKVLGVSERRACRVLGQHRATQRKPKVVAIDEERLTADIIRLAEQYGRYGYRRITALLRREGWMVNANRVERLPGASHPADAGGVTRWRCVASRSCGNGDGEPPAIGSRAVNGSRSRKSSLNEVGSGSTTDPASG